MSDERHWDPDATPLEHLVERGLRAIVPFTRALALTSQNLDGRRWRLHIWVSIVWGRSLDRISKSYYA